MAIPYVSFSYQHQLLHEKVKEAMNRVYDSNSYILGKEVVQFEAAYATLFNVKYTLGVGNGYDALRIALQSLGVGKRDEVMVPANTYIASWLAITALGAIPVPVEPDERTYNINATGIATRISTRTKTIMPVHLFGNACDMDGIMALARSNDLTVVEDNAQAHLAKWNGKYTGTFGDINATSFYPSKNLGAIGDGGAITTNNDVLYARAKLIRNYGSDEKYHNPVIGVNSRLDEIQAAVLSVKLESLGLFTAMRRIIAKRYTAQLQDIYQVTVPACEHEENHVYHIYPIQVKDRDQLQQYLASKGVETLIHYPIPTYLQPAYKDLNVKKGSFPVTERFATQTLSLPIYPGLSESEIDFVVECIGDYYKQ